MPSEFKKKDPRLSKMDGVKFVPEVPATILVLGQCGSGKSSILWSLLTKAYVVGKTKKKSVFDEALYFLGTADAEDCFKKIPIENHLILRDFDVVDFDNYMEDLKEHQLDRIAKGKSMMNPLIVFDDFASENILKKTKVGGAPPIQKLCLTSRHEAGMTVIYLSQFYKNTGFTSPAVRGNLTTIILSKMANNEVRKVAEEFCEMYEVDEFLEHYDRVMASAPFQFLVWERRRPMNTDRWTHGFTKPLPPSQKVLRMRSMNGIQKLKHEYSSSEDSD
jgi:ABC-type dipeptide/oligopeptide/nickel transport system ATPase component